MKLCLVFSSFFFARLQISLGRIPISGLCATLFILSMQPMVFAANITIDTVPVGNAGNAADDTGFGAVPYNYRIGTTEVTNAQYAAFLNAKAASDPLELYDSYMGFVGLFGGINRSGSSGNYSYSTIVGREDLPVTHVSWFDAIRFVNWLHNGQGSGDTEMGAYTLFGGTPTPSNGRDITRSPGATWWLPSEDEWYKAAYHKNDGNTANYFEYPTSSDFIPSSDAPVGGLNSANYNLVVGNMTDVGAYAASVSPYGTHDQGGNAFEWNETFVDELERGIRGGNFVVYGEFLSSSSRLSSNPSNGAFGIGFRVATVPEPSTLALTGMAIVCGIVFSRRRR